MTIYEKKTISFRYIECLRNNTELLNVKISSINFLTKLSNHVIYEL